MIHEAAGEAKHADSEAAILHRPDQLSLHSPEERWAAARGDGDRVAEEATAAARYMADTDPTVQRVLQKIHTSHHSGDQLLSVETTYLAEALKAGGSDLRQTLAEYRLRWSPLTAGSKIYMAFPTDRADEPGGAQFSTWTDYKYMIHEVIHTAADPKFEAYVHNHAPPGMGNTILEGTVDHFAQQVWEALVAELKANINNDEIGTVQGLPGNSGGGQKVSATLLGMLKTYAPAPLYRQQVPLIRAGIAALDGGENRLRAAYFYGDVDHFFPPAEHGPVGSSSSHDMATPSDHEASSSSHHGAASSSLLSGPSHQSESRATMDRQIQRLNSGTPLADEDWHVVRDAINGLSSDQDTAGMRTLENALRHHGAAKAIELADHINWMIKQYHSG